LRWLGERSKSGRRCSSGIASERAAANHRLKLVGADFLVLADQWNATHDGPPEMMGQLFHLFEAPNRFGLPAFYTLHVWAWKESPTGTFVNWHSNISCDGFNGDKH